MGFNPELFHHHLLCDLSAAYKNLTNTQSFAAHLLSSNILKKFEGAAGRAAHDRAVELFMSVNSSIVDFSIDEVDPEVRSVLCRAQQLFDSWFPCGSFYEPRPTNGSFGPGKSKDVGCASQYVKYTDSLSSTNRDVTAFFAAAHLLDPSARSALRAQLSKGTKLVRSSKLTTVPKNDLIDRTICIEPSANMFLQQAIRHDLEVILSRLGLSVQDQQFRQRSMAKVGSSDNYYSTIDLSSASDTIGLSFCQWLLPSDLLFWLELARTPSFEYQGREHVLRMISSMGNATTFPLQTLIFFSLVHGVYQVLNLPIRTSRDKFGRATVGVFGDDIIVVPAAYDLLVRVLHSCGFKVNLEKSFKNGLFKESCGGDFYDGTYVRPVYLKTLKGPHDWYSAINRLNRWSVLHRIPLWRTTGYLESLLKYTLTVPMWEQDTAGIHTPGVLGKYKALRYVSVPRAFTNYNSDVAIRLCSAGYVDSATDHVLSVPIRDSGAWRLVTDYSIGDGGTKLLPGVKIPGFEPSIVSHRGGAGE